MGGGEGGCLVLYFGGRGVGVGGMSRNLFCSYLSFFLPFLFGTGRTSILTYPLAIPSKPHAIFRSKQLKSIVLENTLSILLIKPNICFYSPTDTASQGSRDGTVVGTLASHQCGPGSIPGLGVICGLSLLLVLVLAPRGFSPGTPVFPSPQKPTFPNSNSIWNQRATGVSIITDC